MSEGKARQADHLEQAIDHGHGVELARAKPAGQRGERDGRERGTALSPIISLRRSKRSSAQPAPSPPIATGAV
jgi:hypothetical protein